MINFIQQLHFLRPEWLWLLPLVVGAFITLHLLRSKSSHWYEVIDPLLIEYLLDNPANNQANRRTVLPLIGAALACCIAAIAMAGPSWEKLPSVTEQKTDAMIIIADLTLSMHATDVKPSRLIRTRYKLLELLKQRKAGQTALIAYSGDAHIVSPLTDDASTIAALVPSLSPEIMPSIGSNAVAAFNSANQLLLNSGIGRAKIVWFTDEALRADVSAISNLINNNQFIIIGVGSEAGGPVPLPSGKFVKDTTGRIVNAQLSRNRLRDIAANSGGSYWDIQDDNSDINAVLAENVLDQINSIDSINSNANKPEARQPIIADNWHDRGAYLALLLLPFALLLFRRGWILALVLAVNLQTIEVAEANNEAEVTEDKFEWQNLWQTPDQQAYALEQQKRHSEAAQLFKDEAWKGISEYQSGDYQQALETLSQLAEKNNSDVSHYNHGHALARSNDLDAALSAYDKALTLNPNMEDAKQAKSIIEALKKSQEQQQNNSDKQDEANNQESTEKNNEENNKKSNAESNEENNGESSEENSENSQQQKQSDSESSNELLDRQSEQDLDQQNEKPSTQKDNPQEADKTQAKPEMDDKEEKADGENKTTNLQASDEQLNAEQQAQLEQWLKKIPDDPGGLLRRKFQYERNVRERQGKVIDDREQGQLW
ncbi:VWA domain-containing protein [Pseudomonadales bacterium]|nr:VWA domain-containing protein [Pseudomonadales bacterium]